MLMKGNICVINVISGRLLSLSTAVGKKSEIYVFIYKIDLFYKSSNATKTVLYV